MHAFEQNRRPARISIALHSKSLPQCWQAKITRLPDAKYWQRVLQ
jgi:hypothetical protein